MKSHLCRNSIVLWVAVFLFLQSELFGQGMNDGIASIVSALRSREFDKALQLLQPALQSAPNNPRLWTFQGLAYSGKGEQKSALGSYQKALKSSPDYLPALEGAAQLEYEAGSTDAVPLLEHVLRLLPQDSTTHAMLAVLAYKRGDCPNAAQHFSESEQILDSQPGAMQEYGVCLLKLKQTDKALRIFQGLLASHPDNARARRGLATIQLDAGQPQNALATLEPLLNSNPDVSTMQLAAAVYEANKDTPNAVKVLREAIVRNALETSLYVDFADIAMNHQSF
jgi:Tfp pilus assembly protein PilF